MDYNRWQPMTASCDGQLPTTANQWTSTEDGYTTLQSLDQCYMDQGLHMDCTRESMELQSLGQRTAGAGQQLSTTAMLTQGTNMEDSHAAPRSLDHRFICTGGPSTSSRLAAHAVHWNSGHLD